MMLRANKYIKKLLENSKHRQTPWDYYGKDGLTLPQIEWRNENSYSVMGIIGVEGRLFPRYSHLILLKRSDGDYVLLSPSSKKDKGLPCFLYNILNIEEFLKRYSVSPLFLEWDKQEVEELHFQLQSIKDKSTRGFIETEPNEETRIIELA